MMKVTCHLSFEQRLESIYLAIVLALDELDFTECPLANDLDGSKFFRLPFRSQETKIPCLCSPHPINLLLFSHL